MLEDMLITKCCARKIEIMEYVITIEIRIADGMLRVRRQNSPKALVS